MAYQVRIARNAQKQINRIQAENRERILEALLTLPEDPRPRNSKKLQGREGYRLRIGTYRVLYRIDDELSEILVAEVWHRQRDYR